MKSTPQGWPRFASTVVYRDGAAAIDWLCKAFGFVVKIKVEGEDGRIEHCELIYGDGLIMLTQENSQATSAWKRALRSPQSLQAANTQTLMFYVDAVDAHCAQARAMGATIVEEPALHDYGADYWADRSYGAIDPEGHIWWISERLRDPPIA